MTKRQTNRTSTPRRVICLTPLQEARVAEVFAAAWRLRGFTREQLMDQNKSQRFHIVAARQEVMAALLLAGLTKSEVGRVLCRDHSTVDWGIHSVEQDAERMQRARDMAHANRRADLPRLLRNALPHIADADVRAIEQYLCVCVIGEMNPQVRGRDLAWAKYILQQSRRVEHVAGALTSCGLNHAASLLTAIMARDVRRSA